MWHFNEPLFLRYIYIYAINNCQKKLKRNKMAKESSVRVASIRSSCMYEVADFFIIIGLYVFQIRIQFCNFFFFSFFCLIMLKSPKYLFHESIISILSLCLRKNFSLIQDSRNQKGKEVKKIYIYVYIREKKCKQYCNLEKNILIISFFFFFLLFFFFYFLNCDRRKI